jgi:hypothetical protein
MPNEMLSGMNEWQERLVKMEKLAMTGAEKFVREGGLIIASNAKREFRGRLLGSKKTSKKGRVYYAGAPKYPAQPPRPTNRTGNLASSINLQQVRRFNGGAESLTGTHVKYAAPVNYGTERSRPFPFMEPALEKSMPKLRELAEKYLGAMPVKES